MGPDLDASDKNFLLYTLLSERGCLAMDGEGGLGICT